MKDFINAPYDVSNATFRQNIIFCNGKIINGYSKKVGYEETRDKIKLLRNLILRMYNSGYLNPEDKRVDPIECIEYFWRQSGGEFRLVLSLYEDHFLFNADFERPELNDFLKQFYQLIKSGQNPYEKLYITVKAKPSDPLKDQALQFSNKGNLLLHCMYLLKKDKWPYGMVEDFFIEYSNRKFNGPSEKDLEFLKNFKF